ncbi:acyl-CoA dehydrogenase family protein [Pseudomonas asplenii]|uniref:Acyl-CoA dehydrogenase, C-terminal domain n=1 Tax=Pseudomonas asplenii TaxID=53407 RepID=A0A1H6P730_9PSED|nr:acyl-CoA dehydrogenase family protein [Pseudomonas fuscovaginae]SEI21957.1 Acyl-CoA dehydrogenase, C-terminal domain [Pseudomonas fuscovaginae]
MNNPDILIHDELQTLLSRFTPAPEPGARESHLIEIMRSLQAHGFDQLPLPGHGKTLLRWQRLAQVAGHDLSLAKLYEGHTDALAILAECEADHLQDPAIWGVWAAEPPYARTRIVARQGSRVHLRGRKAWCSGARQVNRGLLTAWDEEGHQQLVAIDLNEPTRQLDSSTWHAVGMAATASVEIEFFDTAAYLVGQPGDYLARPGFWQGGAGIAACWYGASAALAESLRHYCCTRSADPHAQAHLGAVEAALCAARATLRECAAWIDAHPQADASAHVRRLRAVVEETASKVIDHVGRALGATPYCRDPHFAQLAADLPVYMRQSHAERDLAELGQQVADAAPGSWQL